MQINIHFYGGIFVKEQHFYEGIFIDKQHFYEFSTQRLRL